MTNQAEKKSPWSDERVEKLKKLWSEGFSASQIATKLGPDITRNAVIGKAHRLKLPGRPTGQRKGEERKERKRKPGPCGGLKDPLPLVSIVNVTQSEFAAQAPRAMSLPVPTPLILMQNENDGRITILHLNDKTCRWPIGDPVKEDFCFCGHNPRDRSPYCEYHARLAYQPPQTRMRVHA